MRRSTKLLFAGLAVSAIVVAAGYANTLRLERRVDALEAECKGQSTSNTEASAQKSTRHPEPDASEDFFVPAARVPPGANIFDQFDNPPATWALDYVRVEYPVYADLSDEELGRMLHQRYPGPAWLRDPRICTANELTQIRWDDTGKPANNPDDFTGIQKKIVAAHRAVRDSTEWPPMLALAIFGLAAVPAIWYWLLRRIGELRAALGGNPPEA